MDERNVLKIGCVADDFTGAGDVASFIAETGTRCLLVDGVPDVDFHLDEHDEAVVIALKCRSIPADEAVRQTDAAFKWLHEHQAKTLYYKYCSTFDSTAAGNIGPVLDHLLERYNIPYTILCPALPINQRIVKDGLLYVCGVPLAESPMKDHPLNPMWTSSVSELMQSQSRYPCYNLSYSFYEQSDEVIGRKIAQWKNQSPHFYIAVDYCAEEHGRRIAQLFGDLPLLSGGSALPADLCRLRGGNGAPMEGALLLAGSCSAMTLRQIHYYVSNGGFARQIKPAELIGGRQSAEGLWQFALEHRAHNVLFYSSQAPDDMDEDLACSQAEISAILEKTMARLAQLAVENGYKKIIVAGGETSGAVMKALDTNAYRIGESVAPGVPVLIPQNRQDMRLVLKSGNFGQEDFFSRAAHVIEQ